jgi:CubicO group peptidase (beta-lactamase class C family)
VAALVVAFADSLALPSLVVATTQGGVRTVYTAGDVGGVRPDAHTRYEVGSVTKAITALALADAVGRGEVTLETPLGTLLPDSVRLSGALGAVRLVDLATHTSGLPRLPDNLRPATLLDPYADYTPADLMSFVGSATPAAPPGETYAYSNAGAGLLAYVLARRAGTDVETLLRSRVLAPLGMADAAFGGPVAPPHTEAGDAIAPWTWTDALAGAGALGASAADLLALAEAVVAPAATPLADAVRLSIHPRAAAPGRFRVGLVWHLLPAEGGAGPETVFHNGRTFGSWAFVGAVPEAGVGVVVLTNRSVGAEPFALRLLARLSGAR